MKSINKKAQNSLPMTALILTLTALMIGFQNCREPLIVRENKSQRTEPSPVPRISPIVDSSGDLTLRTPASIGQIVPHCQQDVNYNACIYKKNPVAQKAGIINNLDNPRAVLQQLISLQSYAVNMTGTVGEFLKNNHFDIKVDSAYIRARLSGGKWTTSISHRDLSVEQAMAYYWLMYQKEWMELNARTWHATNKKVNVEISDGAAPTLFCAYWSMSENKIHFCGIQAALSGDIIVHEAGHANFHHANDQRVLNDLCDTHVRCSNRQSLCSLSEEDLSDPNLHQCCLSEKGCLFAINEGQADFHTSLLFSDQTQIGEFVVNKLEGIGSCASTSPLRDPQANKSLTASKAFNSCEKDLNGKGEIHVMGILYNSIWWEIYNHPDVNKKEIVILFSEHLPLLTYKDNFETAGRKIVNLARQLYRGNKGQNYANIIRQEFTRRGLNL